MNLIDLRLVATQILGFLIMLWVLRRWAWDPVLRMLEDRRARIAGEFKEAERQQAEAERAKARYEQELRGIESQARARLQEAVVEGQKVAAEIRAQAHEDAQRRLARADELIAHEREKATELLKQHVIDLSLRSAEKILRRELDDPAHRRLVSEFIDEVGMAP